MRIHKLHRSAVLLALIASLALSLAGCDRPSGSHTGTETNGETRPEGVTGNAELSVTPDTIPEVPETDEAPSGGDYTPTHETVISLGEVITADGTGVEIDGSMITITAAGQYLISGTLANGQIVVDTQDTAKVELILNGASVSSAFGPAIYVKSAPKRVILTTTKDSVNLLSDGSNYLVPDDQQADGGIYPNTCIYACDDLTLNGEGTLRVTGNADKGINTKDDLKIEGGTVIIESVGAGIRANDSLSILGGELHVTAGEDGIKTANAETEGKGQIDVQGGALYITATGDGLSAATDLTVSGGTVVIETKDTDGSTLKEQSSSNNTTTNPGMSSGRPGMGGGMGRPGGGMMEDNSNKSSISAKGMKAAGTLTVSGGKITITAVDDGLHSNDRLLVTDGSIYIRSADDGMHADKELTIRGGTTEIAQSYEGLEALHISIEGGTNRVTASDDGTNASGGTSSGGMGGGGMRPPFGQWSSGNVATSTDAPRVTISGGYTVINANGDGLDSNGSIVMTGGTMLVYGPTDNGNGPIDTGDGGYEMTISGGLLLAVGSSGMAESATNKGQAVLAATMRSGLSAGETIGVVDSDGRVLAAFKLPKLISSIVFSSSELTAGTSYSVVYGGTITDGAEVIDGVIPTESYTDYSILGSIQAN